MKQTNIIFFALSLIGSGLGYIFIHAQDFGICGYSIFCYNLATLGFSLLYGMGALAVVFLILLLVPQAFKAWKKFAIWFVPLTVLLFIFYPEPGSGDFVSPHPETVYRWVSGVYVLISLAIIALNARKPRS